jgi:hypothetical protein
MAWISEVGAEAFSEPGLGSTSRLLHGAFGLTITYHALKKYQEKCLSFLAIAGQDKHFFIKA